MSQEIKSIVNECSEFCEGSGCQNFVRWPKPAPGYGSCLLIGQTVGVTQIPSDCPKKAGHCQICEESTEAEWEINPYIEELTGNQEYEWICHECYQICVAES